MPRKPKFSDYVEASTAAYDPSKAENLALDKQLSNKNTRVFVTKDGKAIVSFRGTNPKNIKDLGTDALLAIGALQAGTRYKHSVRDLDRVIKKYGKENVTTTGHSLGGALAIAAGTKRDVKNVAFNPGYTPMSFLNRDIVPSKKTEIYRSILDPISVSANLTRIARKGKFKQILPKGLDTHGVSNFSKYMKKKAKKFY